MDGMHGYPPKTPAGMRTELELRVRRIACAGLEIDIGGLPRLAAGIRGLIRRCSAADSCSGLGGKCRGQYDQRAHQGTTSVSPLSIRGISFRESVLLSPRSASWR